MEKCRDCSVCTRIGCLTILAGIVKAFFIVCTAGIYWLYIRLFRKNCPICGHPLRKHSKRRDGSFID